MITVTQKKKVLPVFLEQFAHNKFAPTQVFQCLEEVGLAVSQGLVACMITDAVAKKAIECMVSPTRRLKWKF